MIDPIGTFLWAITINPQACFSCDLGVTVYAVNSTTGAFTAVPNGYTSITDTQLGHLSSLAITK